MSSCLQQVCLSCRQSSSSEPWHEDPSTPKISFHPGLRMVRVNPQKTMFQADFERRSRAGRTEAKESLHSWRRDQLWGCSGMFPRSAEEPLNRADTLSFSRGQHWGIDDRTETNKYQRTYRPGSLARSLLRKRRLSSCRQQTRLRGETQANLEERLLPERSLSPDGNSSRRHILLHSFKLRCISLLCFFASSSAISLCQVKSKMRHNRLPLPPFDHLLVLSCISVKIILVI